MLNAIARLWSVGTQGRSPGLKRQIVLSNQLGLFGMCATLPYQIFYVAYDLPMYLTVICLNIVFISIYLSTLLVNRVGYPHAARNLVLTNACVQIFVVTYLTGAGPGVNLFYFTIAAILPLIFYRHRPSVLLGLVALVGLLFVVSQLAFATGSSPGTLPESVVQIMYVSSAAGTVSLTAAFAYLFRVEIDRMEADLTASNRALQKLSTTDELTRVINRRGMDTFLDQEWARMHREGGTLSVLMCDVDYFKPYNDYYGHQAGDAVLQRIAAVLREAARRPSDLVARYGGEEFALILPHTDKADARFVSERILASVQALRLAHGRSGIGPVITVSVGFSTMTPDMDLSARQLLRAADRALYQAKRSGRNCIAFETPVTDNGEG